MKKLQNNFTTPEQSKCLLELGVPEWTADLYTFYSGKTIVARKNVYERRKDFFTKTRKDGYKPIWSVGRLFEIIGICAGMEYIDFEFIAWTQGEWSEKLISIIKDLVEYDKIDFKKLEE